MSFLWENIQNWSQQLWRNTSSNKDEEFNKQIKERLLLAEEDNKKALEILKRELQIKSIEQNRIKENEIQTLESKLNVAEEKKANALNNLKNQATNKINSLNNELNKLKDEIKNQSLISELSLKNKISEAVTNLEKKLIINKFHWKDETWTINKWKINWRKV